MILHYFKIAFRNLWKTKAHSFINLSGLSLGIACCVLIILFVKDEWTFDTFHQKSDRIYRPFTLREMRNGEMNTSTFTAFPMGPTLKENYEGIEEYTIVNLFSQQVERGENSFPEIINVVSPAFFDIFSFNTISGNTEGALENPNAIIITETIATKYFGDQSPVGQTLAIIVGEEERNFEVTAVLEDIPSNSSLQFQLLISDLNAKYLYPEPMVNGWNMISGVTYVLLGEGVDAQALSGEFASIIEQLFGDRLQGRKFEIGLQPITDIHLNTEMPAGLSPISDPRYTFVLVGIASLILLIACINFMNLSIGRSIARAKEIGVRKVVGAKRTQLLRQFMAEAIMLSMIGLLLGLILASFTLPLFNELAGKSLKMDFTFLNLILFVALALLVGLLAGFYPAIVLSGFQPIKIIKGSLNVGSGRQNLRRILVSGQFALSIFLITSTLIMRKQLSFMQNKNLGYNKESVAVVPINVYSGRGIRDRVNNGFEKSVLGKQQLEALPGVVGVTTAAHEFGTSGWIQIGFPDEEGNPQNFFYNIVDEDYLEVMGIEVVSGRGFRDEQSDRTRAVIVNEAFVKAFNLENPVGERIPDNNFMDHEIIGVVSDFNFTTLHTAVEPLVMALNLNIGFSGAQNINIGSMPTPKFMVRIARGELSETLEAMEAKLQEVYPNEPYSFNFIDETLKAQYQQERDLSKIVTTASILGIVIGCLGLIGLATLTLAGRTKEISIRKVLGASENNIMFILVKGYAILILVSVIISIPFTYYFMDTWLQNFEFRTGLGVSTFGLAAIIALLLAALSIGYQCIKVAFLNPVKALRSE